MRVRYMWHLSKVREQHNVPLILSIWNEILWCCTGLKHRLELSFARRVSLKGLYLFSKLLQHFCVQKINFPICITCLNYQTTKHSNTLFILKKVFEKFTFENPWGGSHEVQRGGNQWSQNGHWSSKLLKKFWNDKFATFSHTWARKLGSLMKWIGFFLGGSWAGLTSLGPAGRPPGVGGNSSGISYFLLSWDPVRVGIAS